MATVKDVLARKSREIVSLPPTATVLEAANLMNERGIGGVPVIDQGRMVGIFTERDILRRVVSAARDPAATRLAEVMTSPVVTAKPDMPLDQCAALLTSRRIRHLPIGDERGLAGLITIGDLLAFQVDEQQTTIEQLQHFIYDNR
ncbi:MAG: CBS domain-containing protein [Gemmatimonadales bacterium]